MCFSANVSFISSGILFLISIYSIKNANNNTRLFAFIPLLFSIQQASEGFLWLSFNNPLLNNYVPVFIYTFLTFAFIIWPIWIPLSILSLEKNENRKKLLKFILLLGSFVSFYAGFWLIKNGATATLIDNHIAYKFYIPKESLDFITYIICVSLPLFVSSQRYLKFFGALLLFSVAISYLFYIKTLTSIWCFFAAILSCFVYFIISKNKSLSKNYPIRHSE